MYLSVFPRRGRFFGAGRPRTALTFAFAGLSSLSLSNIYIYTPPYYFRTTSVLLPYYFRTTSVLLPYYSRTTPVLLPYYFRTTSVLRTRARARKSDGSRTEVGWKSDGSRTEVGPESDGSRTEAGSRPAGRLAARKIIPDHGKHETAFLSNLNRRSRRS